MDNDLRDTTRRVTQRLFGSFKGGISFDVWKRMDKDLARELSSFFAGRLYTRTVISEVQRELCAVASLVVLNRKNELRAHMHAALNVGATRQQVAEVVFQQVVFAGMPAVADGLDVLRMALEDRGEWEGTAA